MDLRLLGSQPLGNPRAVDHDRFTALGLIADTQQQLHARRIMAVGPVGMGTQLFRRIGGIRHVLVRLEFEQPAEDRLPDIANGVGHRLHRCQIARAVGQHGKAVGKHGFEQRRHAFIARQGGIGKTHGFRIDAAAVPWRGFRHPHRVAGAAEIGKEAGLVMCFDIQVRPVEDQGGAVIAEAGRLWPDHRIDSGGV